MNKKTVLFLSLVAATPFVSAQQISLLEPATSAEVQLIPAPALIAADVDRAAALLKQAQALTPDVMARATKGFAQHGLSWFFYDDPVLKSKTNELGFTLGQALGSLGNALRKDMVNTVQQSVSPRR